jgi:hypothetical protein
MSFLTRALVCCVALIALGLATSTTALAGGGGGNSAGNSQYIDPLHNGGHHHGSGSHGSSSGSSTSTAGSSTLSPSAPSGVGSTASAQGTSRTLPYTGLNLEACVALGLALLLAGFGLRRVLATR